MPDFSGVFSILPEWVRGAAGIMAVSFAIAVLVLAAFLLVRTNTGKGKGVGAAYAVARAKERAEKRDKVLVSIYKTASKVPGLRQYLREVEKAYEAICPYDEAFLIRLASETVIAAFLVSSAGVLAVLAMNYVQEGRFSAYSIVCAGLAVYFLSTETLHLRIRRKEKRFTEELAHYFATVKHSYLARKNVPAAVIEAADGMGHEIVLHAMQVYGILTGTDRKGKVGEYALDPKTNKYMKSFINQAYEASERGDSIREGSDASLFTRNLEFLRVEMMRDGCRREKKDFRFQGYSLVTCLPVFFMVPLKNWGMDFSAEMVGFYQGTGYLIMALSVLATLFVYDSLNKAKEVTLHKAAKEEDIFDKVSRFKSIRRYMELAEGRKEGQAGNIKRMLLETNTNKAVGAFIVQMAVFAAAGTLFAAIFFSTFHYQNRKQLTAEVNNIDSIVYTNSAKQKESIARVILEMTNAHLGAKELPLDVLKEEFNRRMRLPNQESVANACMEVQRRVFAYRKEHFRWYEFVLALCFGAVMGMVPYAGLRYKYSIVLSGRQDEVRQFQSIVIMEREFSDITTQQMLEEMETFSGVYRDGIRKCLNSYSAGPREALLALRDENVGDNEFVEIVDGFLAVESVGVKKAFAEVQNNREMSEGMRALYEDILLEKKTDLTDLITMVPSMLVVGAYFIAPFCYYVFESLMGMFDMLEAFSTF